MEHKHGHMMNSSEHPKDIATKDSVSAYEERKGYICALLNQRSFLLPVNISLRQDVIHSIYLVGIIAFGIITAYGVLFV